MELGRRRALESDLSAYATPRERADLLALLDHFDDDQTAEVREILGRQQMREVCRRRPAAGFAVDRTAWSPDDPTA